MTTLAAARLCSSAAATASHSGALAFQRGLASAAAASGVLRASPCARQQRPTLVLDRNTTSTATAVWHRSFATSRRCADRVPESAARSARLESPAQVLIVGAGPAGLAAAGVFTDLGLGRSLAWADPVFNGGRVQERYREVPSNTKVHTFLDYARACEVFRDIEARAEQGNAIQKLAELDQDRGCELGRAVDAAQVLIGGMLQRDGVKQIIGEVAAADWTADGVWKVTTAAGETFLAERIVLATGSMPRPSITPPGTSLQPLDLDDVLHPSTLHRVLPNPSQARIAVVGASHSAVLALRNLYNAGVPHLVNFARSELKYAVYKKDYILYDNTGLKGVAADWARDYLEEAGSMRDTSRITRVALPGPEAQNPSEDEVYAKHLEGCTHILHAWGYVPRPIPRITASGLYSAPKSGATVEFDHDTGRFFWKGQKEFVPRLFGCGIAFPARVTDPEGNVELAVGFIKFMKFLQKVKDTWAKA
ncbi:hypothetical protein OC834_005000 [Tilletia horrida]|nr:hypothetical protein OC834_005000 [Tilletia horrida]